VMGALDGGHAQAVGGQRRQQFFDQRGLATARPAGDAEQLQREAPWPGSGAGARDGARPGVT
jgi:hypothetical protein